MFKVTVFGQCHLWANSLGDDFISGLPKHFGAKPHEITVEYIRDVEEQRRKAFFSLTKDERAQGISVGVVLDGSDNPVLAKLHPEGKIEPIAELKTLSAVETTKQQIVAINKVERERNSVKG